MIIGKTVLNWYPNEIGVSAELIDSFVKSVEKQAAESIDRYEKERETHFLEDVVGDGEEEFVRVVQTHRGLDNETWNLDSLFKEYFPSLQRRSAFLTVWGYFEHQLDDLCSLYKSEKGFGIDYTDLKHQGISRSSSYLEKVAGLNVHKESQEWIRIKKIQKLRNIVAHRDGSLQDCEPDVVRFINEMDSLSGNDEIILKAGFLSIVVDTWMAYFRLINESIAANEKKSATK